MTTGKLAAAALVMLGIVSCVTPVGYGPLDEDHPQFGYRDNVNADGSHTIFVAADSASNAYAFWDQRAREICGGDVYQKNIFRAERPTITSTGYVTNPYGGGGSYQQEIYGNFLLEGYLRCDVEAEPAQDSEPHFR